MTSGQPRIFFSTTTLPDQVPYLQKKRKEKEKKKKKEKK